MGHSMGGMLATRFALTYPAMTEQLVSVNPLGLEDGRAKGVPWSSVDELQRRAQHHRRQRAGLSAHCLLRAAAWKPEYDKWVEMQAGHVSRRGQGDHGDGTAP